MRNLVFFLTLIGLVACNQSQNFSDETITGLSELPAGAEKIPYDDNPELVKVTVKNTDGSTTGGDYLKGQRSGSWIDHHPNGLVETMTSYVNGVKQGPFVQIDDRGQLEVKAYYHNDKLHGKWIKYNRTRIKEERSYVNGNLDGTTTIYYDNGSVMEESPYVDGKRHGIAIWYDQEGNETIRYEYDNGTLVKE